MRRRDFIKALGGAVGGAAVTWPLAARAQRVPVIGYPQRAIQSVRRGSSARLSKGWARPVTRTARTPRSNSGGRKSVRSTAADGSRTGRSRGGRDRSDHHTRRSCRKGGDGHDPYCIHHDRRSGTDRSRCQSQSPRWQCDRCNPFECGDRAEAGGNTPWGCAFGQDHGAAINPTNPNAEVQSKSIQQAAAKLHADSPYPECQH